MVGPAGVPQRPTRGDLARLEPKTATCFGPRQFCR